MHPQSSTEELVVEQHAGELNCVSHGAISLMGRRRSMEDAMTVAPGAVGAGAYDFFAVYDGYGCSDNVAKAYSCRLHKVLAQEVAAACEEIIDWNKVMPACFRKMDQEATVVSSASAAAVVVVGKEEIVVANCGGDSTSRAVLFGRDTVIPLSDHSKPDGQDKTEMVYAGGGRIKNAGDGPMDVESRGGPYVVISEPVVRVTKRKESDNFLVIGSYGLWSAVSDEVACLVVKRCLEGTCFKDKDGDGAHDAAARLATLAIARGSKDNISIVVVQLNTPSASGI